MVYVSIHTYLYVTLNDWVKEVSKYMYVVTTYVLLISSLVHVNVVVALQCVGKYWQGIHQKRPFYSTSLLVVLHIHIQVFFRQKINHDSTANQGRLLCSFLFRFHNGSFHEFPISFVTFKKSVLFHLMGLSKVKSYKWY